MTHEPDVLRRDLIYHAEALADKLVIVAIDSPEKQVKAAITRANKFLQDMDKYMEPAGDDNA